MQLHAHASSRSPAPRSSAAPATPPRRHQRLHLAADSGSRLGVFPDDPPAELSTICLSAQQVFVLHLFRTLLFRGAILRAAAGPKTVELTACTDM